AGWLTLPVLFLQQYLCLGLMTLGFFLVMRGNWPGRLSLTIDRPQARAYVSEFREYSAPLFVTALFSAIAISVERWMLQYFDGSVEQGYFSISQRIGVACFVFVTAMIPLLTRELAVAHAKNDAREMARLLDRYAPMIYSVSAWMCCFVMVEAAAVLRLFGGEQFVGALLPVQIMALYSIHQGYGQLSGAVYYATGQTRLLRNLSLINQTVGLVMAWLFMAPGDLFGLGLGARGLAWKMLLAQFIAVNMFLYAATRHVPFHYGRNLLHQMICPLVCAGLALAARFTTEAIGLGDAASLPRFFISGMLYTAICIPASFLLPFAFGVRQGELITQGRRLLTWFSTR
ncbi:MAG: lipopolysaccharide biosynthesis protein, partial [Desulfovibrio sp.]|nr:lipopolysaccharide biosynthesis protein [Desulfovibrio sp.]